MALPQDGVNMNELPKTSTIPTGKELLFIDPTTNEGGVITLEDLTKQILQNLTSQTFTLDQGTKTLPAALNELNSKTFLLGKSIGIANTKNLNNIHDGIYFYNGWGWDLKPPTNGTVPFINGTGIWIRMTLDASTIDIVISGKDAIIYTSENKANSWTAK